MKLIENTDSVMFESISDSWASNTKICCNEEESFLYFWGHCIYVTIVSKTECQFICYIDLCIAGLKIPNNLAWIDWGATTQEIDRLYRAVGEQVGDNFE